jgi:hypothetical protein
LCTRGGSVDSLGEFLEGPCAIGLGLDQGGDRAQKGAIGRALGRMRLPGSFAVLQASFQNDRRFWLFDPCNLDSWRRIAADWDPAHFSRRVIVQWMEEAKRRAREKARA